MLEENPESAALIDSNAYNAEQPLPRDIRQHIENEIKDEVKQHARLKRSTFGLEVFDKVLFNVANIGVFALSVFATYKTNLANDGNWLQKRTDKFIKFLTEGKAVKSVLGKNIDEDTARNFNMILWSFGDGIIALPFIAALKKQRATIGECIDTIFGMVPENKEVYKNQPEEGAKSVFLGRVAAFCSVMPTFFLLNSKDRKDPASFSLNDVLFKKPATWITENNVAGIRTFLENKQFNSKQVEGLVETGVFETFYTTLCTWVLFVVSPITARFDREQREKEEAQKPANNIAGFQRRNETAGEENTQETTVETKWQGRVEPKTTATLQPQESYLASTKQSRENANHAVTV